jgi:hypothetical protein
MLTYVGVKPAPLAWPKNQQEFSNSDYVQLNPVSEDSNLVILAKHVLQHA